MIEIREEFESIHQMLKIIENRKNNNVMEYRHSSQASGDGNSFYGTDSYEEALDLFMNGDKEKYDMIREGLKTTSENIKTNLMPKRQIRTGVVGYAPNVPNAIMGLPNSMIYTDKINIKRKTVSILYSICANCDVTAHTLTKSGVAVLNVINSLELSGYRVEVKILFFNAIGSKEKTRAMVTVKRYNDHLDLMKMAFPLANPGMFRRFGFKWIETQPKLTDGSYNYGYGKDNSDEDISDDKSVYLNLSRISSCNYNSEKIIEKYFKNNVN